MSWFRNSKAATTPDYTGLQLQTSVNTLPIPIVWGQTKAAANIVWYQNFQTHGGGSGGKGGFFGGGDASSYTYTADLIMALCEGPISGIGIIWRDQSTYTLAELGLTLFNGTTPQTIWGYLSSAYPIQALAYQGTCYACAASYQLGDEADIGNHNFEIIGVLAGTGVNGIDADPAQVVNDFLTNPQYGAGFSARQHQCDDAVRLRRRRLVADLLRRARHRLQPCSGGSGAGIEHLCALAANPQLRRGLERRPAEIHSLWRR